MRVLSYRKTAAFAVVVLVCCGGVLAEVKPAGIFGHHMVFQRDQSVPVWGWAHPGERITVKFAGQTVSTQTDADGKWMVRLASMPACNQGQTMTIQGAKENLSFNDILVGEVWVCSGQSNMAMVVADSANAKEEIAAGNDSKIRHISITNSPNVNLSKDTSGIWQVCSSDTVQNFTAVGYYFAQELRKAYGVPVGLINASWSGSLVEAWIPLDRLRTEKLSPGMLSYYDKCIQDRDKVWEKYKTAQDEQACFRKEGILTERQIEPENRGLTHGWAKPTLDDSEWETVTLPRVCEEFIHDDGTIWFRRTVTIPAEWEGKTLRLRLGAIDDYDVTYYNGVQVGATDNKTPSWWITSRDYTVPGELVTAGKAVIAVRVFDDISEGGFAGVPKQMMLSGPKSSIPLAGVWKYKAETILSPGKLIGTIPQPAGPNDYLAPGSLFGGIIHPLIPYAVRGVIWYQGESNVGRPAEYAMLLSTMISEWRNRWGQGYFPFGIVQLPNFIAQPNTPDSLDGWALLREAQTDVVTTVPNTGLAVTIDIGDAENIHPKNKQAVGKRLALWAHAKVYGETDRIYSGPMFQHMKIIGDKAYCLFDHSDGGLVCKGSQPTGFMIAGNDGKFHCAKAKVDGKSVVVWSKDVPSPKNVRYGMSGNPPVNLYNKAGLPAMPFRTDR